MLTTNLKQTELADLLNHSRTTILNWEAGKTEPTLSNIIKISEILSARLSELIGIPWSEFPTPEENRLLFSYRHLSDVGKNAVKKWQTHFSMRNSQLADALGIDADFLHNENDVFVDAVREDYGNRGRRQAEKLIADAGALFAGGDLDEDEKQGVLNALQEAFYECKRRNAEKYNPFKNKKK